MKNNEASAPGLSDEELKGILRNEGAWPELATRCVRAIRERTRASAATVGEPVREADYCTESNCRRCNTPKALRTPDMDHAGLGSKPQAAQQQENNK